MIVQEQLRKNLAALGASEREVALRDRVLDDLERSEDRRRAIEGRLQEMAQAAIREHAQHEDILNTLFKGTA